MVFDRKVIEMKDVKATARRLKREIQLVEFLNEIKTGDTVSMDSPETPPWFQEGTLYQISEVTFTYFAETSILRWNDANSFAASEVGQPLQFFWTNNREFFGRQLSTAESFRFCQLTGTKLHS